MCLCEYVCGRADQQGIIYTFLKMIRCGILSYYVAATAQGPGDHGTESECYELTGTLTHT